MSAYVPLSVRYGNRRKKLGWWLKGRCEAFALRLAPWLRQVPPPLYEGFVHLKGGPHDGERTKTKAPFGKEARFPGWEDAGGRYVISSSSYEHHVGYTWQEDS